MGVVLFVTKKRYTNRKKKKKTGAANMRIRRDRALNEGDKK